MENEDLKNRINNLLKLIDERSQLNKKTLDLNQELIDMCRILENKIEKEVERLNYYENIFSHVSINNGRKFLEIVLQPQYFQDYNIYIGRVGTRSKKLVMPLKGKEIGRPNNEPFIEKVYLEDVEEEYERDEVFS